jgi:hypothetical protein
MATETEEKIATDKPKGTLGNSASPLNKQWLKKLANKHRKAKAHRRTIRRSHTNG